MHIWSNASMRSRFIAAACAAALAALLPPTAAAGGSTVTFTETATFDGCHDEVNFMPARMEAARARLPADYELKTRETGAEASLAVSELRCDVTLGGERLPGQASMAVGLLELSGAPSGGWDDPKATDWYLLFWTTDSKRLSQWLQAGTAVSAAYEPELVYDYTVPRTLGEPVGAAPFRFHAPGPSEWAYTVEGTAAVQHQGPALPITEDWWQDTRTADGNTWRVKLAVLQHDDYIAPADVTVAAQPGSQLESLMVSNPTTPDPAVSVLIDHWELVKTRTLLR